MGGHVGTMVRCGEFAVEIDRELAPVIQWLWARGIETTHCCQGDPFQFAYIMFPPGPHALGFIEAMLGLGLPEQKVCGGCTDKFYRTVLKVDPNNWPWRWECQWHFRHKYGDHTLTCRFPYRDIAKIVDRLKKTP